MRYLVTQQNYTYTQPTPYPPYLEPHGPVDEVKIDVVRLQRLERGHETFPGFGLGVASAPAFGGDEKVFAFD